MKKLELNLKELLWMNRMSQMDLYRKTVIIDKMRRPEIGENDTYGVRQGTISEMCNGKTKRVPMEALELIIEALGIEDMNDLFKIVEK